MPRDTLPLALYRAATRVLGKPLAHRARRRLAAQGVDAERSAERDGYASRARPRGPLVWFHGASVGETLTILPLITRLDGPAILVTSGTATSAQILADRLPATAIHQFAPMDHPGAVARFLDHWHPDLAVFTESEIWPGLILRSAVRGIPLALVNARLSTRSLARWTRVPDTAAALFGRFSLVTTQDAATRDGLAPFLATGAHRHDGNLKAAAVPPPVDREEEVRYRDLIGHRPVWVASSTHPGEEEPILRAHARFLDAHPDALLILAPRHPHRGDEVHALATAHAPTARVSQGEPPEPQTRILLADTIGQTGLWYRLAPLVFLAGSFGRAGGHNPWEAAALGCAILHGPNVRNARTDYDRLSAAGAALPVTPDGLGPTVTALLSDPARLAGMQTAARDAAGHAEALADAIAADLRRLIRT